MNLIKSRAMIVTKISDEAEGIKSLYLEFQDGGKSPNIDPGAHVEIELQDGLIRSYSLSNAPEHRNLYRITVARDINSSGGSIFLHDSVRVGDILQVSEQLNNFKLDTDAEFSLFIAGGIGVTPFVPMIARLNELNRAWRIVYTARTRNRAALLDDLAWLEGQGRGKVELNFNEEPGGTLIDLPTVLGSIPKGSHVYCCGPEPLLEKFRAVAAEHKIDDECVHFEYFSGHVDAATAGGFEVVCAKSKLTVQVMEGQTILSALIAAGLDIPFACSEGICGSCKTSVLEGEPDHRDLILSSKERQANDVMYVCCSGSQSKRLVLDL